MENLIRADAPTTRRPFYRRHAWRYDRSKNINFAADKIVVADRTNRSEFLFANAAA